MVKYITFGRMVVCVMLFYFGADEAHAFELKNISFSDTEEIEGKFCSLVGCRTSTKFLFTVCVGALYMEHPAFDAQEIVHTEEIKRVVIHFVFRKASAKAVAKDIREGFKNNGWSSSSAIADKVTCLAYYMTEPMYKNDRIVITYIPGRGTEVRVKDSIKGVIEGREFMTALFTIWFSDRKMESVVLTKDMEDLKKKSQQQSTK